MLPPSGSAASMHRATAMVCFGDLQFIQTRPFMPTAVSKGNMEPSKGNKKCLGSSSLDEEIFDVIEEVSSRIRNE